MMRIITGKAKGIHLKTLEGDATRPTAERVKEAIFSMLQFDLEGRTALDLFAGSGQMGLEAVSRGAAFAVMVDRSKAAVKIIEENVAKTKLKPWCRVLQSDCLDFIHHNKGTQFDIIILDPPYASGLYAPVIRALLEANMLKPTSMIVCESDHDAIFGEDVNLSERFTLKKQSKYSRTVITILEPSERKPTVAIVPGSFDPITYGHLDLVERASKQYDKVYLAVMVNPQKKYMFTMDQRCQIADAAIRPFSNVEVISSEGMLWRLAKDLDACAIVKGYRNETDLAYEQSMAKFNREHNPDAETVLLESKSDLLNVSSTVVRERILKKESLAELMPPEAEALAYQFMES